MAECNICTTSSSTLSDTSFRNTKKVCNNYAFQHVATKKCKSYYYICLGSLIHAIHKEIEDRYTPNEYLYLIASRCMKRLYTWVHQLKHKELLMKNFVNSFVTSVALFAVGVKLARESGAWRVF